MGKDLYVSALLDVYGFCLPEKQRKIVRYYYDDDLSLAEISENEGISRQGVRDYVHRAELELKKYESGCGYCEKFLRLKALGSRLRGGDEASLEEMLELIENL